ncbi:unnamed protein product [Symbiodinium sp. CCMP2456]|nr:unnamed protein product [Symbiodinium sp. CCMP2456]
MGRELTSTEVTGHGPASDLTADSAGASVGGCFGLLTGAWVAITQRNLLVLPVSVIGGAVSFGFFLGCGMIIRCEEQKGGAMIHSQLVSVDASTRPRPLLGATGVSFAPLVQALRRRDE